MGKKNLCKYHAEVLVNVAPFRLPRFLSFLCSTTLFSSFLRFTARFSRNCAYLKMKSDRPSSGEVEPMIAKELPVHCSPWE